MYHLFGCSPVCLSRDCKFRFIQHSFEVNKLNYSDEEKSSCFKDIKYEHTSISSSRWTWCLFIEKWSFTAAFIHHLKALCLLLIYLRGFKIICLCCRNLYCGDNLSSSSKIALESNEAGFWTVGMVFCRADSIWLVLLKLSTAGWISKCSFGDWWCSLWDQAGGEKNTHWWSRIIHKTSRTLCLNLALPITSECNRTGFSF